MAGAVQESKRGVPVPFHEGQAAGQQLHCAAGARGSGTAGARARPNVEANRRAEGTSELNRRLGAVEKGAAALGRCGVAALPDIMAGALQESKPGASEPHPDGQATG